MELSKKDKIAIRELINKGKMAEFHQGMTHLKEVIMQWDGTTENAQVNYYPLFTALKDFDKQIAWRYDGLTGSGYVDIVIIQILDELLDVSELNVLSANVKEDILYRVNARNRFTAEG